MQLDFALYICIVVGCREDWLDCGSREVLEETGLTLRNVEYVGAVNGISLADNYHYVTIVVRGQVDTSKLAEPVNMEPQKCDGETGIF